MDQRPDRGYGLDRSSEFPVLIGLGPVRSRSFSSLETGPSNTIFKSVSGRTYYIENFDFPKERPLSLGVCLHTS